MDIRNNTLIDYIDMLKSESLVPGGGTVTALSGIIGMSLAIKVIKNESSSQANEIEEIRNTLMYIMEKDTVAYTKVADAYKILDGYKKSIALQTALKESTEIPLNIMMLTFLAIKVINKFQEKNQISSPEQKMLLSIAKNNLHAAIKGAYLYVNVNLNRIKDEDYSISLLQKASDIVGW